MKNSGLNVYGIQTIKYIINYNISCTTSIIYISADSSNNNMYIGIRYSYTITFPRCSVALPILVFNHIFTLRLTLSLSHKSKHVRGVRFLSFFNFVVRKCYETHVVHANYCRLGSVAMWILCVLRDMHSCYIGSTRWAIAEQCTPDSTSWFHLYCTNAKIVKKYEYKRQAKK